MVDLGFIAQKIYVVGGLGKSGCSTAQVLRASGAQLAIMDLVTLKLC